LDRGHAPGQPLELPVAERRGDASVGAWGRSPPVGDESLLARVVGRGNLLAALARVKRVEIPKSGGGVRTLGVPIVLDRCIQQALLQGLQPEWDKTFSEGSDGVRPGCSAHQAVAHAQT